MNEYLVSGKQKKMHQTSRKEKKKKEEGALFRMKQRGADRLLVIGQRNHRLARRQVPQTNGGVVRAGDDLRLGVLTRDAGHRVGVTAEDVHLRLGANVPHLTDDFFLIKETNKSEAI